MGGWEAIQGHFGMGMGGRAGGGGGRGGGGRAIQGLISTYEL